MRNVKVVLWLAVALAASSSFGACKPKTVTEKAIDKVEDAGHEMNQGVKRAEDRVKKAVK